MKLSNLLFFILDEADKWVFFMSLGLIGRLVEDAANNELLQIYSRIPARSNANNEYRLQVGTWFCISFVDVFILRYAPFRLHPPTSRPNLPQSDVGGPERPRLRSRHGPAGQFLRRRHGPRAEAALQFPQPLVHRRRAS